MLCVHWEYVAHMARDSRSSSWIEIANIIFPRCLCLKQTHYPQISMIIFISILRLLRVSWYCAYTCIILHFKISYIRVTNIRSLEVHWVLQGNIYWCIMKKQKQIFFASWFVKVMLAHQSFQHFWLKRTRCGIWMGLLSKLREMRRLSVREDWMVLDTVSMSSLSIHKHEYVRLWSTVTPFFRMRSDIHLIWSCS